MIAQISHAADPISDSAPKRETLVLACSVAPLCDRQECLRIRAYGTGSILAPNRKNTSGEWKKAPPECWQDKSRQGAARSGCCFAWTNWRLRQCARRARNVCGTAKLFMARDFPHLAEARNGA